MTMREYGVSVCSENCGLLITSCSGWTSDDPAVSDIVRDRIENNMEAHCPGCGCRVGADPNGSWREVWVPVGVAEWIAGWIRTCPECGPYPKTCPADTGLVAVEEDGGTCIQCWVDSALKAVGENV